jgi:hypothetical protein
VFDPFDHVDMVAANSLEGFRSAYEGCRDVDVDEDIGEYFERQPRQGAHPARPSPVVPLVSCSGRANPAESKSWVVALSISGNIKRSYKLSKGRRAS